MEIEGMRLRAPRRPLGLIPPAIDAHYKDLHGCVLLDSIRDASQPVVEPSNLRFRDIKSRGRPEVDVTLLALAPARMAPRPDDQTLPLACSLSLSVLYHLLVQLDRTIAVIE